MTGRSRGMPWTPVLIVFIPSAGSARATSRPPASSAATAGRRRTRSSTAPHTRDSPWLRWRSFARYGTRPFSVQPLRPRKASIAGRNVSEPRTATATTRIVPTPKATNVELPARNMPAMAIKAVLPTRDLHADRVRPGRGDRGLVPVHRRRHRRLSGAGAFGDLHRPVTAAGWDHQDRQQPRAPAAGRGRLAPPARLPRRSHDAGPLESGAGGGSRARSRR